MLARSTAKDQLRGEISRDWKPVLAGQMRRQAWLIAPRPGPFFAARSWAGCTTNMFGFDLRQAQLSYMKYYNEARTHLSLEKDAPVSRAVERAGQILCRPILGGLHHQYVRI
jgi:hypothetical protein